MRLSIVRDVWVLPVVMANMQPHAKHFRTSKKNFSIYSNECVLHKEGKPVLFQVKTQLLHAKLLDRQCKAQKMFSCP